MPQCHTTGWCDSMSRGQSQHAEEKEWVCKQGIHEWTKSTPQCKVSVNRIFQQMQIVLDLHSLAPVKQEKLKLLLIHPFTHHDTTLRFNLWTKSVGRRQSTILAFKILHVLHSWMDPTYYNKHIAKRFGLYQLQPGDDTDPPHVLDDTDTATDGYQSDASTASTVIVDAIACVGASVPHAHHRMRLPQRWL